MSTVVLSALLAAAGAAAAQPVNRIEEDGTWWGASVWIIITLVFVILAVIFVWKGAKEPNRR